VAGGTPEKVGTKAEGAGAPGQLTPIHKWHPLAPAGVLALCKSSPQPDYDCGFHPQGRLNQAESPAKQDGSLPLWPEPKATIFGWTQTKTATLK
jgi:hypothetical protein